jgi:hypothetical protein
MTKANIGNSQVSIKIGQNTVLKAYRGSNVLYNPIAAPTTTTTTTTAAPIAPATMSVFRTGDYTISGNGTAASPWFVARDAFDGSIPVWRITGGPVQVTFQFLNHMEGNDDNYDITEYVYYTPNDLNIQKNNRSSYGTLVASGRNTTVTVTIQEGYIQMRRNNNFWGPCTDAWINGQPTEYGRPSCRFYIS